MDTKLKLPNQIKLTFGQIVSLAGDYYGDPRNPIIIPSEMLKPLNENKRKHNRQRFLKAFGKLALNPSRHIRAEVKKLLEMINDDHKVQESGKGKLHSDREWDEATGGDWIWLPKVGHFPYSWGRMMYLAANNTDHFQPQATEAYLAGHQCAIDKARQAAKEKDPQEKKNLLMEAYSMEAFAGHYLSDCFSSGHIRTPRSGLQNFQESARWPLNKLYPSVGDYLSKEMHDEDCKYGLRVKNKRGDRWTAYGDKSLNIKKNSRNYKLGVEAMQKSADQVFEAFKNPSKKINFNMVTDIIPFVDQDAKNNIPLFQKKNGKWYYRSKLDLQSTATRKLERGIWAAFYLWRHPHRKNSIN